MKKILALVLALVMVLMVGAAFAATDGSITVQNTTSGKSYEVYKVFSATYSGTNVSYFYDGSNATFLANLQASTSPFTVTGPVDGLYNVIKKSDAGDSTVINFIKDNAENFGDAVATQNGNGEALTFTDLDYGYYYIKSEVGAVVTIDSALKDVTLIDKNQTTTLDKQEQVEAGTWLYQGIDHDEENVPTAKVGDTVNYKVVGTITRYIGEDKVKSFTWTDTMTAGLTPDQNVVITINGEAPVVAATVTYPTAQTASIVLPVLDSDGNFLYNSNSSYEITYSAKINENAITRDEENNTVDLDYKDTGNQDHDIDDDDTKVKDYQITLTKQDASSKAKLADAHFDLYDAATEGNKYNLVLVPNAEAGATYGTKDSTVNNVYRPAKAGETAVEMVVGTTGIIEIKGLENGNYYFEETAAPSGYNKLTARTEAATITNDNATITVDNATGTELPSTGGIGTTIFYIVGGLLVIGAAVVLVARRKAND